MGNEKLSASYLEKHPEAIPPPVVASPAHRKPAFPRRRVVLACLTFTILVHCLGSWFGQIRQDIIGREGIWIAQAFGGRTTGKLEHKKVPFGKVAEQVFL